MTRNPRILFLNQSISPHFLEMAVEVASAAGPCVLVTGSCGSGRQGNLEICQAPAYSSSSIASRLWTWSRFMAHVALRSWHIRGRPLLFVVTNPPFLPYLALILNRLRRWPYVMLVWDIYPDVLVRFGLLTERHPVARLWRRLSRSAMAKAQLVITISEGMAATLRSHLGVCDRASCAVEVLPNWVDTVTIRAIPKPQNWFARRHQQEGRLTVLYSGNMGETQDLSSLIAAAGRLRNESTVSFMLIGDGSGRQRVEHAIDELELENVCLLPRQPEDVLPYSIATGDVAVVTLDSGAEGLSMPSKTYVMMAAGCALLGLSAPGSDLDQLITEQEVGINVAPGDVDGLVTAIKRFQADRPFRELCRKNARLAAERCFSAEGALSAYRERLLSLIEQPGRESAP